jgi:hypothetical protein
LAWLSFIGAVHGQNGQMTEQRNPLPGGTDLAELQKEERGREAFQQMVSAWMARNHWSFRGLADLSEMVTRQLIAPAVPSWLPGEYEQGALVVANDCVWRAACRTDQSPGQLRDAKVGRKRAEPEAWVLVTPLRRIHASQVNSLVLGQLKAPSIAIFDALGTLNQYLAKLRSGRGEALADGGLAERAAAATVLEDEDGPFGPEEMLSVYLGHLQPAQSAYRLSPQEASEESRRMARRIREGMATADLDLIEDWPRFVSVYPSSDNGRLTKVRDVALGRASWSAEQVEDERVAVEIALSKLKRLKQSRAAEGRS